MHKVFLFNLRAIALPGDLIIDWDIKVEKKLMCARVDFIEYWQFDRHSDRVAISFDTTLEWIRLELSWNL